LAQRKFPINIFLVLGARPQIIKSAPVIHKAKKDPEIHLEVVHTGQHYDYRMTKVFFEELHIPDPVVNLEVGSGTHAWQTAEIMIRLEKFLIERKPDFVLTPGDTNSTLAGALTAAKLCIPVAHIEAGARSYDMQMPEEINRCLTDHCSTLLLTSTENCTKNLLKEGINKNRICQTGDTMYDVLLQQMPKAEKTPILKQLDLEPKTYALLTLHRAENVDNFQNLKGIVKAITKLKQLTIVFPIHPRTQKQLAQYKFDEVIQKNCHIRVTQPVGYLETLKLIKNAKMVLTDSGGMQKEAFWLKTPCITLRDGTEWVETVKFKANYLAGANTKKIVKTVKAIVGNEETISERLKSLPNPFGDGNASQKVLDAVKACPLESG
jgi:UDP-N-acetylglucosamine 2-epimerase (non-hydrolysing)